jgi:CDP-diacylglycerol--glycerol-3-phosphate 3-phosphatidyltransferase
MNIPNVLTFFRILLIPILVIVFYLPIENNHTAAAIIFFIAGATDWLDGYLARVLKQTSPFGAFLDPVADKLIVVISLVLLVGENLPCLVFPAVIIIGREIVISALREWMAEVGKRANVAVSLVGKYKTAIQMFALLFLLAYKPSGQFWLAFLGYILLYVAAGLTLWSMIIYLKAAWNDLTFSEK